MGRRQFRVAGQVNGVCTGRWERAFLLRESLTDAHGLVRGRPRLPPPGDACGETGCLSLVDGGNSRPCAQAPG